MLLVLNLTLLLPHSIFPFSSHGRRRGGTQFSLKYYIRYNNTFRLECSWIFIQFNEVFVSFFVRVFIFIILRYRSVSWVISIRAEKCIFILLGRLVTTTICTYLFFVFLINISMWIISLFDQLLLVIFLCFRTALWVIFFLSPLPFQGCYMFSKTLWCD